MEKELQMDQPKKKVAIACQGGGSHAAFAAGVLLRLLEPKPEPEISFWKNHELVGLSGTSGGAICAALVWAGLVKQGPDQAARNLRYFWNDLKAKTPEDAIINFWGYLVAESPVVAEISPYLYNPTAEARVTELLKRHADLGSISATQRTNSPIALLIGATDIRKGHRVVFTKENITARHVVASAAIPPLYRAVEIDKEAYWDGLFATNPPIREFTDPDAAPVKPDEIWVIQINPQDRKEIPHSMSDIVDRRNELSGNLSLAQELYFIDKINELTDQFGSTPGWRYRHIQIRLVEMPFANLSYASKLDRSPSHIQRLIEAGLEHATDFFDARSEWPRPDALCKDNCVI